MNRSIKTIVVFVLISSLAATYAIPDNTDDENVMDLEDLGDQSIVNYIRLLLERIQYIVKYGIPSKGTPPKDPLIMGDYFQRWNDTAQVTGATANIYNMVWTGLGGLTIDAVEFDVRLLKGNITLSFPVLDVTGDYFATGSVNGNPAATNATGKFDVHMGEAVLNITNEIGIENGTFQVIQFDIEFIIYNFDVIMSNLVGDPQLEATLKQNAIDLYNTLYSIVIPNKLQGIADSLTALINSILAGIGPKGDLQFDADLLMWKIHKLGLEVGFTI